MKEGKCIMGEMRKDREKITDTSVLIDTYEKEIWKLKELLSRALQDTNTLEGTKRIVVELSKEKIVFNPDKVIIISLLLLTVVLTYCLVLNVY